MKIGRVSRTAEAAAALRANHYQHAENPVFSDNFALEMTNARWRMLLSNPIFKKILNSDLLNYSLGRLTAQVVGRSRYTEDLLIDALNRGEIRQYVLVGAGLDSFILRLAQNYPELNIFEVDHIDTQKIKIHKLKKLGKIPNNAHFVSIDFKKENLSDALLRSSFDVTQPTFFSWLGTTHYLTPETTLNILQNIAFIAHKNSEVVMDYSIDYHELTGIERIGSFAVAQFTRFLKEPLIGSFSSKHLHQTLQNMGYVVIEDLSGADITERYFSRRSDRIRHTQATHLIHFKKT